MYTRIVVPLDGSALAERALPHGEELARILGVPLHLIRVIDMVSTAGFAGIEFGYNDNLIVSTSRSEETAADEYLAEYQGHYAGRGLRVTTERRTGGVTHELLEAARDGDLYVMASHGRGGVTRWFLGSVVEEVTRHSQVPILVIRATSTEHPRAVSTPHVATRSG